MGVVVPIGHKNRSLMHDIRSTPEYEIPIDTELTIESPMSREV